ncbi:MAG: prepilin peptidase [Bryobacteraceae bacterium]|jgi:leader peptidase (prepilin peptidase)/N-methyltransferase
MIEACFALLFGLLIGSFLNVCIYRWPRDLSVVRPRSYCPACEAPIAWYDNVPLASFVILGGRCRHCRARISPRYPLVELLTGGLFFLLVHRYGLTPIAGKMCVFTAMMVALLFSDLEQRILPDEFTVWGTVAGLAFAIFTPAPDGTAYFLLWMVGLHSNGWFVRLAAAAVAAALPAGLLWSAGWLYQKARHREGVGPGDIKMVALLGCYLGLEAGLVTLILGSIAGSVLGFAYIRATRKDPSTYELPFGTFLSGAALILVVFSQQIFGW